MIMKQVKVCKISLKSICLWLLFFISIPVAAQNDTLSNLPQYLFPQFDSSIVRLKTGEFSKTLMNYNTLTERMAFYQKGAVLDLVKPESVEMIYIHKRVFVPFEKAFYEVILNSTVSFYIQHKSDMVSKGRPAALGTTSQTSGVTSVSKLVGPKNSYNMKLPEDFDIKPYKIYWVRINGEMHRFLNERQFLKIFPAQEDQLKKFIKESDININKPGDLLKLATYCNEVML
jgi:hypothetical protein